MQIRIDELCFCTNFNGRDLSSFGDIATLKNGQISLSDHGLYSPYSSKNLIDRNRLKKFMQVGIDVTCMHTNFDGRDLSSFGDIVTFKTAKFPFRGMDYRVMEKFNRLELAQNIHASRDLCNMHVHQFWWT